MKSFTNYWENQGAEYNNLINSDVSLDFFNLMTQAQLKDKNMTLKGRIKFNKMRRTERISGLPFFCFTHTINPFTKYSFTNENNKTTLNGNWKLYNNNNHYFSLYSLLNMNTNEDEMSADLKAHLRYHYKANSLISVGIEDYKHGKGKIPNQLSLYALQSYKKDNAMNIFGGFYSSYLLKERYLNFHKFLLSYSNRKFNSLLSFNLTKDNDKETKTPFTKNISLKVFNSVSDKVILGGDIDCNITKNIITRRLFVNYALDENTFLKSKWEDSDKSFTLTLHQSFRDLIKFSLSGKFNFVRNDYDKSHCSIPRLKSKFGMSIELNQAII